MGESIQTELANELFTKLGSAAVGGLTFEDFGMWNVCLDVQIKIVCCKNTNGVIYEGSVADTLLYLYKNGNHFDAISGMCAFFASKNDITENM